jgi:hypothetical protein
MMDDGDSMDLESSQPSASGRASASSTPQQPAPPPPPPLQTPPTLNREQCQRLWAKIKQLHKRTLINCATRCSWLETLCFNLQQLEGEISQEVLRELQRSRERLRVMQLPDTATRRNPYRYYEKLTTLSGEMNKGKILLCRSPPSLAQVNAPETAYKIVAVKQFTTAELRGISQLSKSDDPRREVAMLLHLNRLAAPNVVRLIDFFDPDTNSTDPGHFWMVLEYLVRLQLLHPIVTPFRTASERVHKNLTRDHFATLNIQPDGDMLDYVVARKNANNMLSEAEVAPLFRQYCESIYLMHVNLIAHRDTKPENLMVLLNGYDNIADTSETAPSTQGGRASTSPTNVGVTTTTTESRVRKIDMGVAVHLKRGKFACK